MMIRIVFLVFCAMGMLNVEAHAQFFLEQAKENLAVSGGEHRNGSLLIHNTSADPENIKVYWEDFEYKAPYDGTKNFLPGGTAPGSASQWITFTPQTFTIPGFGQQNVDYTINVPSDIKEGHYGVLFFERSGSMMTANKEEVSLVTRIGCLFFIEPKDKNKKAVLQDIKVKAKNVAVNFVNQGNVILIPHSTYYLMQDGGLVLLRGDLGKKYVPPGVTAALEINFKKPLSAGHYTIVLNSDLDEGDVAVKEIGLVVDASGQLTVENSRD